MNPSLPFPPITSRVAGIFKGGGAKGLVYVGALHELRARGIWFDSVAGSSAGAITAMLIACGFQPDDLAARASDALRQVPGNFFRGFLPWADRTLFRTRSLEHWLETQLALALGKSAGSPPTTFRELAAREGAIELNVVGMDLDRRQPIVFNATTTPHCGVARTVVASCAIPLAMPPGRVMLPGKDGRSRQVHRVVDGGAWANYPAFVYRDASFRQYAGLEPFAADRVTLGFVIVQDAPPPGAASQRPPIPTAPAPEMIRSASPHKSAMDRGAGRRTGRLGSVLNWTLLRWAATVIVPLVACVAMVFWLIDDTHGVFNGFRWAGPARIATAVLAVLIAAAASAVALAIAFFQARFGHEIADVVFPSVLAALAVGPGVPDWVGCSPEDRVVRLWPPEQVGTVSFKVYPRVADYVMQTAAAAASEQLDTLFPEYRRSQAVARLSVRPRPGPRPVAARDRVLAFCAWAAFVGLSWWWFGNLLVTFVAAVWGGGLLGLAFKGTAEPLSDDRIAPELTVAPPVDRRQSTLGLFLLTVLLSFLLIDSITWLQARTYVTLAVVALLLVPIVLFFMARSVLRGRARDWRLGHSTPRTLGFPWRAVILGTTATVTALRWFESTTDLSAVTTYPLIFFTALLWFGVGQLLSAGSRLSANREASRYEVELGSS